MINAWRALASVIGVIAGLIGIYHGYNETLQGNATPAGIVISAIGPPCQGSGCLPAMTIIPNFFISGVTTIIAAIAIVIWAAAFVQRNYGGVVLIALSIMLLLVGGGFIPPPLGIIAGVVGTRGKRAQV